MSVVDLKSLELYVQNGIPDGGQLVFNIYIHNLASVEWEVCFSSFFPSFFLSFILAFLLCFTSLFLLFSHSLSLSLLQVSYKLSSFATLDLEINKRTDALRDVAFPVINKDTLKLILGPGKYKNKAQDLELYRALLEQWVFSIVSRIDTFPNDLQDIVEDFFLLPDGPNSNRNQNINGGNSHNNGNNNNGIANDNDNEDQETDDNRTEKEDCESTGISESYGDDSQDSSGELHQKKKKKRIIKGFKKRVSKIFLGSLNGTKEGNSSPTERDNLTSVSDPRDSKSSYETSSGRASDPSFIGSTYGDEYDKVRQVQTTRLISCKVQRGGERSRGVYIYEVKIPIFLNFII